MRVAFLGNAEWSVPTLEAIARSPHSVIRVVTRVPRPVRRGSGTVPTPVAEAARVLDLPLAEVDTIKAGPGFDELAGQPFDALVVVAYGEILPAAVLSVPRVAPVNLHFSLLPELRGPSPVQRALMEDLRVTGVTTIRMDEGLDTGPILLQADEAIAEPDDAGSLGARLAALGARLVVDTLDRLDAGAAGERPQDESRATYAPKLRPEERVIAWGSEARRVVGLVRALAPRPGATTTFRGRVLKILRASARSNLEQGRPGREPPTASGSVVAASEDGIAVAAADGVVALEEVAPEGRRRMLGEEFARGYRPEIGEILG
jgi:methionyl-tRNA formyltransferase